MQLHPVERLQRFCNPLYLIARLKRDQLGAPTDLPDQRPQSHRDAGCSLSNTRCFRSLTA